MTSCWENVMSSAKGMKSVTVARPLSVWKVVTRMFVSGM